MNFMRSLKTHLQTIHFSIVSKDRYSQGIWNTKTSRIHLIKTTTFKNPIGHWLYIISVWLILALKMYFCCSFKQHDTWFGSESKEKPLTLVYTMCLFANRFVSLATCLNQTTGINRVHLFRLVCFMWGTHLYGVRESGVFIHEESIKSISCHDG